MLPLKLRFTVGMKLFVYIRGFDNALESTTSTRPIIHMRCSTTTDKDVDCRSTAKPRSRLGAGNVNPHHGNKRGTRRLMIESALVLLLLLLLIRRSIHPSGSSTGNHQSAAWGAHFSGKADNLLQFSDMEANTRWTSAVGPEHLKIYVAELPEKYTWKAWSSYVGGEWQAAADFAMPLGPVVDGHVHLRMTNQFANDLWWYHQLLISPLRVTSYDEADVVFVPGMFARGDPFTEQDMHRHFVEFFQEYPAFLPNVTKKPHILGYPRVAWDNIQLLKDTPAAHPFLFTAIEAFSAREPESGVDFVVIPYQAHLHWSRGYAPGLVPPAPEALAARKTLLVSESFGTRLAFRQRLHQHCLDRPSDCVHHEYKDHNSTDFLQSWHLTERSWYCFQPPGDSPTRRSLFDCLLAGTIPVVFDYRIYDSLPFSDALDWYQLVEQLSPTDMEATNAVDLLRERHQPGRALQLLSNIRLAARLLQYSLNPVHELIRYDAINTVHPEDDAFTFSWKAIMRKLCAQQRLPAAQCALGSTAQ